MKAVNLIPTEQRRARPPASAPAAPTSWSACSRRCSSWSVAYVLTSNNVTERENEAAAAKAEANQLEAKAAQSGAFTNFAQIKQTRLASVAASPDVASTGSA